MKGIHLNGVSCALNLMILMISDPDDSDKSSKSRKQSVPLITRGANNREVLFEDISTNGCHSKRKQR